MTLRGIDISNWEPDIKLKRLHIDFAIFKATEGMNYKDPTLKGYARQAKRAGLLWGCYHFARNNIPVEEARFFYSTVKKYVGKCIFILDMEDSSIKNPAKYCAKFCDEFTRLSGVRPLIYTSSAFRSRFSGYKYIYDYYDLWLAGYPKSYSGWTHDKCPYDSGRWPYIAMWQFTDRGRLSGAKYHLDLDYAYMTKKQWKTYAKVDKALIN